MYYLISAIIAIITFFLGMFIAMIKLNKEQIDKARLKEIDKIYGEPIRQFLGKPSIIFNNAIQNISPQFCETYIQGHKAEQDNLDMICGIGYGKSLEFLIKDYAIYLNPDKRNDIEKETLTKCIKTYLIDDNLKTSAELAAWLRNDETHYIRKHTDKDISDLKDLIKLTITIIENSEAKKMLEQQTENIKKTFK